MCASKIARTLPVTGDELPMYAPLPVACPVKAHVGGEAEEEGILRAAEHAHLAFERRVAKAEGLEPVLARRAPCRG